MRTILVTGAAGFIGSHVVDEFIEKGDTVIALDDLSGGYIENINKKAITIIGSINDKENMEKIFTMYKIDYVFHLAAYAAEGLSHFIRTFNYENNLMGSINLINLAVNHKVKTFVFTSTMAVYGEGVPPFDEGMVPSPVDPYGVAKYAVELDLKAAYDMFGMNYIIFRPHNVYGPRQNIADKYRNVIGIFINKVINKLPLSIYGDGNQTRAFSYISDVAPIIANSIDMLQFDKQIINVGGDVPFTINEMSEVLEEVVGEHLEKQWLEARNEVKHAFSSHDKLNCLLPVQNEKVSLKEGLRKMYEWALTSKKYESVKFENIEIREKLPSFWL